VPKADIVRARRCRRFHRSLSRLVGPIPTPHQTPQQGNTPFPIGSRLRGRAGPTRAGGNVRHDTSAPAENCTGANRQMIGNADLPCPTAKSPTSTLPDIPT
jgi:hypothetical protein